jgi:peptidoglycan/xylan/chitin deacetylase (PgdA/CDA1 family)
MSTILMYHYIGTPPPMPDPHRGLTVPPEEFKHQLVTMKRMGLRSLSPEEYSSGLLEGNLRKTVWLTFDDGYLNNYEKAFPALVEAGMKATFFVMPGSSLENKEGFINLSQMKEMLAEGMSIGSHTLNHVKLAKIGDQKLLDEEITSSKKRLEDALGVEIASFCYPYGSWNQQVIETTQRAGYRLAISTIRDNRNEESDRWLLKRAMIQPGRQGMNFRYVFGPIYHFIHARKNRRRWKASK